MDRAGPRHYVFRYTSAAAVGILLGWLLTRCSGDTQAAAAETGSLISLGGSSSGSSFSLHGKVSNLVPGKPAVLWVRVSNPYESRMRVLRIDVAAGDASPRCRAAHNLVVANYRSARPSVRPYVVPGHRSIKVPLRIELVDSPRRNQDACKAVVFPLRYTGAAIRVGAR